jgi:hypothetical protein
MMVSDTIFYPAFAASFEIKEAKIKLTFLKEEVANKAAEKTETALLELGELCSVYASQLEHYEHLLALADAFSRQSKEGKK